MVSRVAITRFDENCAESLKQALGMIGGIGDLNTVERPVVVKVGVFSHRAQNHASVNVVNAILESFDKSPKIFLAESDNYQGKGLDRLQIWKTLFTNRVVPFNLSDDTETREVTLVGEPMSLSHILFKPNVLVNTHILRSFERGSILKNLFGCIPTPKRIKYHKILYSLLADVYEAIGGIDLAVLDGTYLWHGAGGAPVQMNVLLAGRDAVAVEVAGAVLAGLNPDKMPLIQEFVKRGLGEGDLQNIDIMGVSLKSLKEEYASAARIQKKPRVRRGSPQTWGGQAYHMMEDLIKEGFFKLPNKRTREEVFKAFETKGLPTKGKEDKIAQSLARRVKKGALKATKNRAGWIYWTE